MQYYVNGFAVTKECFYDMRSKPIRELTKDENGAECWSVIKNRTNYHFQEMVRPTTIKVYGE